MEIINKNENQQNNIGGDAACNVVCAGACLIYPVASLGGWASKAV